MYVLSTQMLDVTVSQLTSLHPSLGAQVSLKHQDVKESWAQLQELWKYVMNANFSSFSVRRTFCGFEWFCQLLSGAVVKLQCYSQISAHKFDPNEFR